MTIDRTITHRLITIENRLERVEAKLDRLLSMLDPDGPTNATMQADLESILSSIGQAVLTPKLEVKG